MTTPEPLIRNISDTACWVAYFRATESERPDAVFKDPYARRLAGDRGEKIGTSIKFMRQAGWSMVARTWIIDRLVTQHVARGYDCVVNLAAGLDTRPYRLALPSNLRWIEVDLPELLEYKEGVMKGEKPVCRLEHLALDLSDRAKRQRFFADVGRASQRVLVITEGLLIYLAPEDIGSLATDIAAAPAFDRWVTDLTSPALLKMMLRRMGSPLEQAGTPFRFAPEEGPAFFSRYGWKPLEVHSLFHAGSRLHRLPWLLSLMARLFKSEAFQAKRPWGGILLLGKDV